MLTILVLAIVLASGGKGAVQSGASNVMNSDYSYQVNTYNSDGFSSYAGHMFGGSYSPWALIFALVGAGVVVAAALVGILLKIFVCNVFEVGGRSFYIENLYAVPGVGKLLSAFRSGYYGNVVKTMFFRDLFTFLWTLLFIIPGIIKSYEYKMVPYLLAEYPDKDRKYQVIAVAYHAKSNEKMIVYQQLFDNFKILTDTFDDFFNQPEAEVHIEIPADDRKDNDADTKEDLKGVNPVLMGFFDRDTCTDKIEYIVQVRDKLDDRLVSDIAASMDITIEEGSLDDKIDSLLICLRTKAKYECNRFR